MKLWMTDDSGNSYEVRALTPILNVPHGKVYVGWLTSEQKSPAFLKLNPRERRGHAQVQPASRAGRSIN